MGQAVALITRWAERRQVDRATVELAEMEAALARLDGTDKLGEVADPTYMVSFLQERWGESELAMG